MLGLATLLLRTSERTRLKYSKHWRHLCVVSSSECFRCWFELTLGLGAS